MSYIEKRIISGDYMEIIRHSISYNQYQPRKKYREPKQNLTLQKQKKQNIKEAKRNLKRLMHCNFVDGEDLFVTLTFKNKKTVDIDTALSEIKNFVRRLKYYRKVNGLTKLKYLWCIGKDKKNGLHFHLIINKISFDVVKKTWKPSKNAGRITISTLEYDTTTGLGETARYFIDNALEVDKLRITGDDDIENFNKKLLKKWSCSQNLEKPIIPEGYPRLIKSYVIQEIPHDYKLYKTLSSETVGTEYGKYQYIELIKIKKMRN